MILYFLKNKLVPGIMIHWLKTLTLTLVFHLRVQNLAIPFSISFLLMYLRNNWKIVQTLGSLPPGW